MRKYPGIWEDVDVPDGLNRSQVQDINRLQENAAARGGWGWMDGLQRDVDNYLKREGFEKTTQVTTEWRKKRD